MSQEAKNDLPALVFLTLVGVGFLLMILSLPNQGWAATDDTGPKLYAFDWLVGGAVFYGCLLGPLFILDRLLRDMAAA